MGPRTRSRSDSRSPSRSRSRSRSRRRSPSRSRSFSKSRSRTPPRRKRSYSRSRSRSFSRSRSRSPYYRNKRRSSRSHSRSPMSSRKRHVGSREAPPPGKCLGVFGLSLYTTEREVKDLFNKYGRVDDCNIVHDHATGRSRGFAFLNMSSLSEAEDAKERLNGAELDGRRIRVDYSITQRAHTPTPGVYMGRPSTSSKRGYRGSNYNPRYDRNRGGGYYNDRRKSYSRSRSRSPAYRDRY